MSDIRTPSLEVKESSTPPRNAPQQAPPDLPPTPSLPADSVTEGGRMTDSGVNGQQDQLGLQDALQSQTQALAAWVDQQYTRNVTSDLSSSALKETAHALSSLEVLLQSLSQTATQHKHTFAELLQRCCALDDRMKPVYALCARLRRMQPVLDALLSKLQDVQKLPIPTAHHSSGALDHIPTTSDTATNHSPAASDHTLAASDDSHTTTAHSSVAEDRSGGAENTSGPEVSSGVRLQELPSDMSTPDGA